MATPRFFGSAGNQSGRQRTPTYPAKDLDADLLSLLRGADIPLSAYDLVHAVSATYRRVSVVAIYRALERLCARDAIERVESTARYRIRDVRNAMLLVCSVCGRVTALDVVAQHDALAQIIADTTFTAGKLVVEAQGICGACRIREDTL